MERGEVERLYRDYRSAVYHLALGIVKTHTAAEDIMQTVFVGILSSHPDSAPLRNPRAWLAVVTKNLALNHLRDYGREELSDTPPESLAADSVEDRAVYSADLERILAPLTPDERLLFSLHFLERFKYREIAALLGRPVGSVQTVCHRARKKIRDALKD